MLNRFNFNWLDLEKFQQKTTRTRLHYWDGEAIVEEKIWPHRAGWVQFKGTLWKARCDRAIQLLPGDRVRVVRRRNTTLIVEPAGKPFFPQDWEERTEG